MKFEPFPKLARLKRSVVITEKLDGTNACVAIEDDGVTMHVGSRTRWITPQSDNFGFAAWCAQHREELLKLGPGRHFGEWWGLGIQRGYGLSERRFSLFNAGRWGDDAVRPACCHVVPVLAEYELCDGAVDVSLARLRTGGSLAAPGYMNPEGIVVYHTAARQLFKVTLDNDALPKSLVAAA